MRILIILLFTIYMFGCVEKTSFKGKIISENQLTNLKIQNKSDLIEKLGQPSYVDEIQNKFFYFTEKSKERNFFNKKTEYSYLFIFEVDQNDNIISKESINLLDKDISLYLKTETPNNIVERGFIEKIFGGVGPQQLPTNNE